MIHDFDTRLKLTEWYKMLLKEKVKIRNSTCFDTMACVKTHFPLSFMCVCLFLRYIYIYIEREREREVFSGLYLYYLELCIIINPMYHHIIKPQ